jgi:hypothetical protein
MSILFSLDATVVYETKYAMFLLLSMAYFTQHDDLQVHPLPENSVYTSQLSMRAPHMCAMFPLSIHCFMGTKAVSITWLLCVVLQ